MTLDKLALMTGRGFNEVHDKMNRGFAEVNDKMNKGFAEINERFEGVDKKFEGVDSPFSLIVPLRVDSLTTFAYIRQVLAQNAGQNTVLTHLLLPESRPRLKQ